MSALSKIKSAGFEISLKSNGNISINPASKLTDVQRDYIKSHKAEILAELEAANDSEPKYKRFIVTSNGVSNNVIVCRGATLESMRQFFAKSEVEVLH